MHSNPNRQKDLEQFLQNHFGKDSYSITPIQGDAGFRSYFRVKSQSDVAIQDTQGCHPQAPNRHPEQHNRHPERSEGSSSKSGGYNDKKRHCLHQKPKLKELDHSLHSGSTQLPSVVEFGKSFILMDCPPSYCSIQPFIEIAHHLRSNAFPAPEIIASDADNGFIILEDFGDTSVKTLIKNSEPQAQESIYYLIVDLLVSIQDKAPPANLKTYDNGLLLSELSLFEEWYIPHVLGRSLTDAESFEYKTIWQEILSNQAPLKASIVLRDYHAENIMYLENRHSINKLGLLDFQDALIGSPIYDLVSVLEDARIKVPRLLALDCLSYFTETQKLNLEDVLTNYHILGAQRNSRILGVFARKFMRDKNDNYLQYMPLVLKYLEQDLSHPVMGKLRKWISKILLNVSEEGSTPSS